MTEHKKPVVFFSHSSLDAEPLNKFRDLIKKKTGGAIDFFLSSDGQSIPLGRNWVHSIEEALQECKLMFVFLSPNSIHSNWVYFEAGYVYSKGIEVVPVGVFGFDLLQMKPPLSLLQGFNISKYESLNNFMFILNKAFGHTHEAHFTEKEHNDIFESNTFMKYGTLKEITKYIDAIQYCIELPSVSRTHPKTLRRRIRMQPR